MRKLQRGIKKENERKNVLGSYYFIIIIKNREIGREMFYSTLQCERERERETKIEKENHNYASPYQDYF